MTTLLEEQMERSDRNNQELRGQLAALTRAFENANLNASPNQSTANHQQEADFIIPAPARRSQLATDNGSKLRHRVEEFPEFTGSKQIGSDIHFWLATIESKTASYVEPFSEDDYRRIVHSRFAGEAQDHLRCVGMLFDKCRTWKDMKRFLRSQFSDPAYEILVETELNNRTLLPNEPIGIFWNFWVYLLNSVIKIRRFDNEMAKKFSESHVTRLIQRLPTTIRLHVEFKFQQQTNIVDQVERLGRVLLSDSSASLRHYRIQQEWLEFKTSPSMQLYYPRVFNNLGWLNQQLRSIGAPEIRSANNRDRVKEKDFSDKQVDNRSQARRVITAKSNGRREFKCVCGGSHRYADCPKESGQAKYRELQARIAKRNHPGVRFLADDNGVYVLSEECNYKEAEDDDIIALLEDDSGEEDFLLADH